MIGKAPIPAKNRFLQRDNDNSDDDDDADADIQCHHASNQGPAHARTLGPSRSLGLGGLSISRRMQRQNPERIALTTAPSLGSPHAESAPAHVVAGSGTNPTYNGATAWPSKGPICS